MANMYEEEGKLHLVIFLCLCFVKPASFPFVYHLKSFVCRANIIDRDIKCQTLPVVLSRRQQKTRNAEYVHKMMTLFICI